MDNLKPKQQFTFLSLLILSLVAINAVGWNVYAEKTARYYDLINVSGKQRMLTQRIAYFATRGNLQQEDLQQLQSALDLIKTNHLRFTAGADELNLAKPQKEDPLHELYFGSARLDQGIHQLIKAVQTYVDSSGAQRPFKMTSSIPNQLLNKTNQAVELYLAEAKQGSQKVLNWLIMLSFLLLIAILIQLSWLYKTIFKTCDHSVSDVMTSDLAEDSADNDSTSTVSATLTQESALKTAPSALTSTPSASAIKAEYQTDLPHPLECKRLLLLNCTQSQVQTLRTELYGIVGLDIVQCKDLESTYSNLVTAETAHRPFDIVLSADAEDYEALQQKVNHSPLKQEYCQLLLTEENQSDHQTRIPLRNIATHLTQAYKPYESLQAHHQIRFNGKRLLLVDDNEINLMVLEGMVQKSEADYVLARDGQQAFDLASKQPFDLIFMDLQMPNMNGYESAKNILQKTQNAQTPIIAVTANHDYEGRCRCIEIGMVDCEAKPVSHQTVEKLLYKFLI